MSYSYAIFDSSDQGKEVDVKGEDSSIRDELYDGQVQKMKHAVGPYFVMSSPLKP